VDTVTLTRPEVERMRAEGRVFTNIAVALSIAAGRLYLLYPAEDGNPILDDLDDPKAMLAGPGLVADDKAAGHPPGVPAA
jgi:hypothetical protein